MYFIWSFETKKNKVAWENKNLLTKLSLEFIKRLLDIRTQLLNIIFKVTYFALVPLISEYTSKIFDENMFRLLSSS